MRYKRRIKYKQRNIGQTESKAETEVRNQKALEDANRGIESKDSVDTSTGDVGKGVGADDTAVNFGDLLKGSSLEEEDKDSLKKALKGK